MIRIITLLEAEEGYRVRHTVTYTEGESGIEVENEFQNRSERPFTLDMMTSFSLDNLSPFQPDDAPYKLRLHRFRAGWSLEGKHWVDTVEELNLESTWFRAFPESERYGCLGSHTVKRWFPFGCVEDRDAGYSGRSRSKRAHRGRWNFQGTGTAIPYPEALRTASSAAGGKKYPWAQVFCLQRHI